MTFILGGVVSEETFGGLAWGDFFTGGPQPRAPVSRAPALPKFEAQLAGGFSLQAVWQPRALNVGADYLSRVAAMLHRTYRLSLSSDGWTSAGDSFASVETCQLLAPPFTGRSCSQCYHQAAV